MTIRPLLLMACSAALLGGAIACGARNAASYTGPDRSETLGGWIEGSWVSEDGAEVLHIARLPDFRRAWYVERAPADNLAEPTHMFVWMLVQTGDRTTAEHWRVTRDDLALNAWQEPRRLVDHFSMYYLRHVPDCDIPFRARRDLFTGSATGDCAPIGRGPLGVTPIALEWGGTNFVLAD